MSLRAHARSRYIWVIHLCSSSFVDIGMLPGAARSRCFCGYFERSLLFVFLSSVRLSIQLLGSFARRSVDARKVPQAVRPVRLAWGVSSRSDKNEVSLVSALR